jgi:hypothetical protein
MKTLITVAALAAALSTFAFSYAAQACDGMKNADSQTQANKGKSKDSKAKKETGTDSNKS